MSIVVVAGCAYYPSLDYVRYEGVDYGYAFGSKQPIYYRYSGRKTTKADKIFEFSIGRKRFKDFNDDHNLASSTITREVFEREGYCSAGYDIQYDKNISGGDLSFPWRVFCR